MADKENLREIDAVEDEEDEGLDKKLEELKKEKANLEATFKKLQSDLAGRERKFLKLQKENEQIRIMVKFLKERVKAAEEALRRLIS